MRKEPAASVTEVSRRPGPRPARQPEFQSRVRTARLPASRKQLRMATTAGVAIAPAIQVTVQDTFNNTVTSSTASITLAMFSRCFRVMKSSRP